MSSVRRSFIQSAARDRRRPARPARSVCPGFTLVELLVTISVFAVLIGILAPAIAGARDAARQIVCGTTQRQLALAQIGYAASNRGAYAGVNGSNSLYLAIIVGGGQPTEIMVNRLLGNTSPGVPTSTMDWITPIMGEEMDWSTNRAKRTQQAFSSLACPSATLINQFLFPGSSPPDAGDFEIVNAEEGYPQISYLSPSTFHYLSSVATDTRLIFSAPGRGVTGSYRKHDPFLETECRVPKSFRPNLDQMDNPGGKVVLSDATRYYSSQFTNGGGPALNFDHNHSPGSFGNFLASSPIYVDATEWGRRESNNRPSHRWQLSIRHGKYSAINSARFDGHVESMNAPEIYRDPTPWFPSGSEFLGGGSATPESLLWADEYRTDTGVAGPITLY